MWGIILRAATNRESLSKREKGAPSGWVMGFPGGSDSRVCLQCRRPSFNPWVRKIPWIGNGNPLQYSYPENPMDRGAWRATVHGAAKSAMTEQLTLGG